MQKFLNYFHKFFKRMPTTDRPLLVIYGSTGAGKSKLAIDIAIRLNGEIISADSMQVYKGLDIITNKVTDAEQKLCPHHLIGFLHPLEEYNIHHFQKDARLIIEDIYSRNKLPIICGGTNYYIHSVLWNHLVKENFEIDTVKENEFEDRMMKLTPDEIYNELKAVDPEYAKTLHPKCTRKIVRSLQIYDRTKKKHSEYLLDQKQQNEDSGSSLLYTNICGIHVHCDSEVLNSRIDKRVNKMLEAGLINELKEFHKDYNKSQVEKGLPPDHYEHGIFQSIGFKEFHEYLKVETKRQETLEKRKERAIERMKLNSWQYAKYQQKWLRKKVINNLDPFPMYQVDATYPDRWNELVLLPSLKLLRKALNWKNFITGVNESTPVFSNLEEVQDALLLKPSTNSKAEVMYGQNVCNICHSKPIFIDLESWQQHLLSRKHYKAVKGLKRKQEFDEMQKHRVHKQLSQTLDQIEEKLKNKSEFVKPEDDL